RELLVAGLAREAVRLQQFDRRAVDQSPTVDRRHHPVLSVEAADQRDHPLGKFLSGDPFLASGVEVVRHVVPPRPSTPGVIGLDWHWGMIRLYGTPDAAPAMRCCGGAPSILLSNVPFHN